MKTLKVTILIFFLSFFSTNANAQFWKKIKRSAEKAINKKIDKNIDDVVNKKKDSPKQKKKKSDTSTNKNDDSTSTNEGSEVNTNSKKEYAKLYRNFKFIPGEKVIFYDDLKFEEVGEFPSRWDLAKGGVEIASLDGEKVILGTTEYDNTISPLFKNKNYLGDEFTIEFDLYIDDISRVNDWVELDISFKTNKGDSYESARKDLRFQFRRAVLSGYVYDDNGSFDFENIAIKNLKDWNHIAISYYKGKLKVYFNEHRVSNLPNFKKEIVDLSVIMDKPSSDGENPNQDMKVAIKNIRIAHGGGQMYKRIMADGKYVTNGILFDSGKATIKPQSMGIINKMVAVMKEKSDWKFKIIGHTDNDGNDTSNLKLSKQRAEAVKQVIVKAGIEENRISTDGKGESEPLNTNSTEEEKANNRRVEFIKN